MIYENVVIGKPVLEPWHFFSTSSEEFEKHDKAMTLYTDERFLPAIMVEVGLVSSRGEVRRNRPELVKELHPIKNEHRDEEDPDEFIDQYLEIKWGKRRLYILVGQ